MSRSKHLPLSTPQGAHRSDWLVETRRLGKFFHPGSTREVRALEDVSIGVARGSFTALVGPSGSGKTTLLGLLGAMEKPTEGNVLFEGRDLTNCSEAELARVRRRIGFIFQNFSLIARLPLWENITWPLVPRGISTAQRRAISEQLLNRFDLADKAHRRPEELSGGEQQRAAVARALCGEPVLILADEPTSNLDQDGAERLQLLLSQIRLEGTTVVVSTHDQRLVAMADTVHRLDHGRLLAPGSEAAGSTGG
ncbi:MAG: ABC transporter ATP-binding protein [Pirellulales bacterium]